MRQQERRRMSAWAVVTSAAKWFFSRAAGPGGGDVGAPGLGEACTGRLSVSLERSEVVAMA